jgi:chromodomain-helicase-DNA-binding protein 1
MASSSYTNGYTSPNPVSVAVPASSSMHSESDDSDTKDAIAHGVSSGEDAPGEEYDEDEPAGEPSDSSDDDVDAEGEPDGDYDSETPPPRPTTHSRSRTSTSQESQRGTKRKASDDDDFTRNPELYGLRRSVCAFLLSQCPLTNHRIGSCSTNSPYCEVLVAYCRVPF